MDASEHTSYHHAGSKRQYNSKRRRALSIEKINKIFELSRQTKGKINYSKIAEELGIAGQTVARYLNGFKPRIDINPYLNRNLSSNAL